MHHYVSLFAQSEHGDWRGFLPDFPCCETAGKSLDFAILNATAALANAAYAWRTPLPQPKTLAEIASDKEWLSANGVAFSRAIVVMIPVHDWTSSDEQKPDSRPQPRLVYAYQPAVDTAVAGPDEQRRGHGA
jgi:predicted RNase H-like HicB family nuclease